MLVLNSKQLSALERAQKTTFISLISNKLYNKSNAWKESLTELEFVKIVTHIVEKGYCIGLKSDIDIYSFVDLSINHFPLLGNTKEFNNNVQSKDIDSSFLMFGALANAKPGYFAAISHPDPIGYWCKKCRIDDV